MKFLANLKAKTPTGGKVVTTIVPTVMVDNLPAVVGPGVVTPHPPAPNVPTHAVGTVIPTSTKVLIGNLPPIRLTDKTTCGCMVITVGKPTVMCG